MWPFNRRRAEESSRESAPAPYAPARAEWRQLPPLQRMVGDQWLVNPSDSLSSRLASWQDPTFLAPLGHAVLPEGPSGAIEPASAAPPEPRRIDLQRNAGSVRVETPSPLRSLQRTASDSERPDPLLDAALSADSGPVELQRSEDAAPPLTESAPAPPAEIADQQPLLGQAFPQAASSEPAPAQRDSDAPSDLPMRSEPQVSASPLGPMPSLQRMAQPDSGPRSDRALEVVASGPAAPAPVQPVGPPFALQRMFIGAQPTPPQSPAPSQPVLASLLASTDPPERRELPVVTAPRSPVPVGDPSPLAGVQRAADPSDTTLRLLGDTGLAALAGRASGGESGRHLGDSGIAPTDSTDGPLIASASGTAPLLGTTGLAAPIIQTIRDEAPPAEPQGPMPIAPLVAESPGPTSTRYVQRLGLGSPVSGPLSDSALFAQRSSASRPGPQPPAPSEPPSGLRSSATGPGSSRLSLQRSGSTPPATGPGLPVSTPAALSPPASSAQMVAPDSSGPPARPLPPPVMVMRSAPTDAVPSVSRSIEAPESLYAPDPFPEAPLLGLRPMEGGFAADGSPATTGSAASEPGTAAVQRSTWSHMPTPSPQADFPLPSSPESFGGPAAGSVALASTTALQRFASAASASTGSIGELRAAQRQEAAEPLPVAAAPVSLQSVPTPSVSLQTMTEVPPPHVEAVVQRVAAPPPPVTVQAADAAPATAPAAAGAAPAADPAALLAVLYEPLVRRLRADLRVDRERRGRLTDL